MSPSRNVIFGRANDVGYQHTAQARVHDRLGVARGQPRIADAAEERLDRGEIDRDNVGRDLAVSLTMTMRGCCGIRCFDEAKACATRLVVPIGHVFDPVLVLDFKTPAVRFGHALGRCAADVVVVHKDWHSGSSLDMLRC
jgi:hypothetical protein